MAQTSSLEGVTDVSLTEELLLLTLEDTGGEFDSVPEIVNGRVRCAAEDYLDAAGAQYVARTPVTAYLRLSESIDLHRLDPAAVGVPVSVVTASSTVASTAVTTSTSGIEAHGWQSGSPTTRSW